jgi:putative transposase
MPPAPGLIGGPRRRSPGAGPNYTIPRPEPDDHALGRSRGGFTTKIHALVDHRLRPVALRLTPGQAGDNPQLVPLLDDWAQQGPVGGRRRQVRLLADKAYSHPSTRDELRRRRIRHTIPERCDQREHRAARGSRGGRPPSFDPARYAQRNTIERGFGRLKQWRGIASRYDKYALVFLGGVLLAATLQYRH